MLVLQLAWEGNYMRKYLKTTWNFILGFLILICFYFISYFIVKLLNISIPSTILGLILFAAALVSGIIKEEWIKPTCDFLIKNMAMFLVPFLGGLIVYKSLLMKNWLAILIVIFVTTTLTIVITGLFVEWGMKLLRLYKYRRNEAKND